VIYRKRSSQVDKNEKNTFPIASLLAALALSAPSYAQTLADGFLCCTVRFDHCRNVNLASDANWVEFRSHFKAGTPAKVSAYQTRSPYANSSQLVGVQSTKPYEFLITADKKELVLKNEYTKHLSPQDYLGQLVVTTDPEVRIETFSPEIQAAIASGRVMVGMTKDQVIMALGYPLKKENPNFVSSPMWRYYYGSFDEIFVVFEAGGKVRTIEGIPFALADVVYSPPPVVKK
jgi:hypothetical protein